MTTTDNSWLHRLFGIYAKWVNFTHQTNVHNWFAIQYKSTNMSLFFVLRLALPCIYVIGLHQSFDPTVWIIRGKQLAISWFYNPYFTLPSRDPSFHRKVIFCNHIICNSIRYKGIWTNSFSYTVDNIVHYFTRVNKAGSSQKKIKNFHIPEVLSFSLLGVVCPLCAIFLFYICLSTLSVETIYC